MLIVEHYLLDVVSVAGASMSGMSRYRLYPNVAQEQQLLTHCGHSRYVWNMALELQETSKARARSLGFCGWRTSRKGHRYPAYTKGLTRPGLALMCRQLTEAREASDWLRDGSVNVQQQALRDFDQAMRNFLKGTHGYPTNRKKFRSEGFRITDFTFALHVQKLNRRWAQVQVPKVGWVRFLLTRPLKECKSYRIVRDRAGRWHVAFGVIPEPINAPGTGQIVGVDRGVTITAALSTGETLNCPQLSVKERAQLRKHQRRACRAPKHSERRLAGYDKVARLKAREADIRKDWVEKTSTMLATRFDVIRLEDLRIKNMTACARGTVEQPGTRVAQKSGLNRAILAQGWGALALRTEQKAPGRVEKVKAAYTSLRCSACGWIDKNSRKNQAEFRCTACGFTCNADTNASINVAAGHAAGTTLPRQPSVREPQRLKLALSG